MDIVVKGRHCEVPARFRTHVLDKLAKLERFDRKVIRVEVELTREPSPRRADQAERVELTVVSRGPTVRAEASAADMHQALDLALGRLEERLRRAADRRRIHKGPRAPVSVAQATAGVLSTERARDGSVELSADRAEGTPVAGTAGADADDTGPFVLREKHHRAAPITLDQALYEMELVGHDFYLFVDAETSLPSVVYRRRAYDYGVIRLTVDNAADPPGALDGRATPPANSGERAATA